MKSYCEWFLSDGTVLYGKEAKAHLHSILSNYENLIDHIHFVLKDCLDHCRISRENTLPSLSKKNRKAAGLTQEEFAARSGLGLRFIRELEQGKETVRMDKVNAALAMFDMEAVPGRKEDK